MTPKQRAHTHKTPDPTGSKCARQKLAVDKVLGNYYLILLSFDTPARHATHIKIPQGELRC